MFADVNTIQGRNYKLINLDTGEEIKFVKWADDEKGVYGQYQLNEKGEIGIFPDGLSQSGTIIDEKKGNIKLVWCGEGEEPPRKEI